VGFTFILVICLAGVFCLAPLALYFLWLALLTRRERPTVLSGQWDFVGLLVGLSGFLLYGGGLVLSIFQSNFRYWMRGNFESLRAAWGQERVTWLFFAFLYLAVVIGSIAVTLAARRRSLVVYNVDPSAFEAILAEVFEQLSRPVERRGNLWVGGVPLLELDRFVGGRTVTVRWVAEDRLLFQEVERLLREAVRTAPVDENPASRWLMASAVGAGLAAVSCFGLLAYAMSLIR
jgi:hypothetical protein